MFSRTSTLKSLKTIAIVAILALAITLMAPSSAFSWPSESDWIELLDSSLNYVWDPQESGNDTSVEIIGNSTKPSGYLFNDGTYIYYRVRLNDDPTAGTNNLKQFGWGFLIDTNLDGADYEWMVMADGIRDEIYIAENTDKTGVGDPSDSAEVFVWSQALDNSSSTPNYTAYQISPTDYFGSQPDWFLEFRFPYDVWLYQMGLTETSVIRYFLGTGRNSRTVSENSGDLVGTSLYTDLSTPVIPTGVRPSTGSVAFVNGLTSTVGVTSIYAGQTLYVRVEDADQNNISSVKETLQVTLSADSGDVITVTLTETGLDTGFFSAAVPTTRNAIDPGDAEFQIRPNETITAAYTDAIDADFDEGEVRYDTLITLPSANLGLSMTVDDYTPTEGQLVMFTLEVYNPGYSNATGIVITDLLPAGLTNHSDAGDGSYSYITGLWSVGNLNVEVTKTLYIWATVNAGTSGQEITNNASITSKGQIDPDESDNSASITLAVGGADLAVTKTVSNSYPNAGTTITYYVEVRNNDAENTVTNIQVKDVLDSDLTFNTLSIINTGTFQNLSGTLLWEIASLAPGSVGRIEFSADLSGGASGIINNTAFINSTHADYDSANDSSTVQIAVNGTDMSVTKTATPPTTNVDETVQYKIKAKNNGPNSATGVQINDLLPTDVSWGWDNSSGSYNPTSGIWSAGDFSIGQVKYLLINTTVNAGTGGSTIDNTAYLDTSGPADVITENNTSTASIYVQSADLEVNKIVNDPAPDVSQVIYYTLTLTNNGPDAATSVVVMDTLPADITYSSQSGDGAYSSATGNWTLGTVAVGATNTISIYATVDAPALSTRTNFINSVSADQDDPNPSNNVDSAILSVGGIDMEITKSVNKYYPAELEYVTFTIIANNIGEYTAELVNMKDSLPSGLILNTATASKGTYKTSDGTWSFKNNEDILPDETVTLTISARVAAGYTGQTIRNTARFISATQSDYDSTNNQSYVDLYIGASDVGITKDVNPKNATVGETVTYTLEVTNYGPGAMSSVEVTDVLPEGLDYSAYTGHGVYNSATGIWNGISLPSAGLSNTIQISAVTNAAYWGWKLTNMAQITDTSGLDYNSANDSASAIMNITAADIALFKTADNSTPLRSTEVQYTVTATNNGPHTVNTLKVEDVIPGALSNLVYSTTHGSYNPATGIWDIGTLTKDDVATFLINAITSGDLTITNEAVINAVDLYDPSSSNDSSSYPITPIGPEVEISKTVVTYYDPVNSTTNPKAIPGAYMDYYITIRNTGNGPAYNVTVEDPLPSAVEMYVGDLDTGYNGGPVVFINGTGARYSGLSYAYSGLNAAGDGLYFSDSLSAPYNYGKNDVTADGSGFDSSLNPVTAFKAEFSGTLRANQSDPPEFQLRFRVRIK